MEPRFHIEGTKQFGTDNFQLNELRLPVIMLHFSGV